MKYIVFATSTAVLLHMQRKVSPRVCETVVLQDKVFLITTVTFEDSLKNIMFPAQGCCSTF